MMKKSSACILILFCITAFLGLGSALGQTKSKDANNFTLPLGDGISLSMSIATFEPGAHKITKCKIINWEGVCLIDDKPVFGTDWELPKKQLNRASLKLAGNSIDLDVSCMFNPRFGKLRAGDFSIKKNEGGYLLHGSFSDGAGSYEAEWLIIQNAAVRTKLAKKEY